MPDLTGWSKSDVTKFGDLLGLTVEFKGEGYVTKQSIAAETEITEKINRDFRRHRIIT